MGNFSNSVPVKKFLKSVNTCICEGFITNSVMSVIYVKLTAETHA